MKLFLTTFPNDLGSLTLEKNWVNLFTGQVDLSHYRFASRQSESFSTTAPSYKKHVRERILDSTSLRRHVRQAVAERSTLFFQNLSPALFSYPIWRGSPVFIATDWVRKLFETPDKKRSGPLLTELHRIVMKSASATICLTDAVARCVLDAYRIPAEKVCRGRMPFNTDLFSPGDITVPSRPRLLFIGGDIRRKGGDLLLQAFSERLRQHADLTFVSNASLAGYNTQGVRVIPDLTFGDSRHPEILRNHDILILPTVQEGYPQVIGEAAASGLAVVTTKFSLGAADVIREGVSGFICSDQQDTINKASFLLENPELLLRMKAEARSHMVQFFSKDILFQEYQTIFSRVRNSPH